MIVVKDFHKAYDKTIAVKGVSFQVAPGQILGIVGPNGAGKTTTLRALAGIIPASGGQLSVAGFDLDTESIAAKQNLAYVPDDPQLFHDMTVSQHLSFTASAYQVENADVKATALLKRFQLTDKTDTPAADLSRGMRQKLAIACAYLHDPRALFLDEPLTGLDPAGIRSLKESIVERAQDGTAVMISSHLLAMVEDICTHVMVMSKGQQKFFGRIDELRAEYAAETEDTTLEDIFFRATSDIRDEEQCDGKDIQDEAADEDSLVNA